MTFASLTSRIALPRSNSLSLRAFLDISRQRRALSRLNDAALADIGLSRLDAIAEAKRPAWDVPGHWRV